MPANRLLLLIVLLLPFNAIAEQGMITVRSAHSVEDTADRFSTIIKDKGLTLFARVDHNRNAESVDLELRPTEVIIFGNPKVGTPLMRCAQSVAIDLPQKMLIWEDEAGEVWLSYNDPSYLKSRHNVEGCDAVVEKISGVLAKLSSAAAKDSK